MSRKGIRPVANYQHRFKNTYLYGCYSPITGDSFVWEIDGVNTKVFAAYLEALSKHRPKEYKIVVIDNAGFHSTRNIRIPENIHLLRLPAYSPELNPCEQVWQYIKQRFKLQVFSTIEKLRKWLHDMCCKMDAELIKSITSNHHYLTCFNRVFNS